jgi:penicillin-binding protein 1C
MNLRISAATWILATALACALCERRRPLFEGLSFSRVQCDREGRLLRLLPASDGQKRLWLSLGEFSPLLINATRARIHVGTAQGQAALALRLSSLLVEGPDTILVNARRRLESWRLRALYGPNELLEAYLNLSSYGPGISGAGAASLVYFGKNPDQLTLTEAVELSTIGELTLRAKAPEAASDRSAASARGLRRRT